MSLLLCVSLGITSCSESEEETIEFPNWKATNDAFYDSIYAVARESIGSQAFVNGVKGNSQWKIIRSWSIVGDTDVAPTNCIVVKVLNEGTGEGCPLYTDTVLVHNMGHLLPSLSYSRGYIIEHSWDGYEDSYNAQTARPRLYGVSGLIDGYTTALLHMRVGDRWQVYIPYTLAYGTSDNDAIPAYSDIVFDISLLGFYHPGDDMPDLNAKQHEIEKE